MAKVTAVLAAGGLALGIVFATHATPAQAVTCSGDGCDGQDPSASGCSAGAYTVTTAPLEEPDGTQDGTVELRYSPTCGTNWSRVTVNISTVNVASVFVKIERGDGLSYTYEVSSRTSPGLQVYGDMVFAPNAPARASGSLNWIDQMTLTKRGATGMTNWY